MSGYIRTTQSGGLQTSLMGFTTAQLFIAHEDIVRELEQRKEQIGECAVCAVAATS